MKMRTKLRDHEEKVFETRTHWISMVRPFLFLLAAVALVILAYFVLEPGRGIMVLRWASLILLAVGVLYFGYREWYRRRDIWVVTNLRVIDEKGIFTLYTKESPLEKINNISYRQTIPGRILHYGEVEIQTAAEDGATIYRMIAHPRELKDTIARCRDEYSRDLVKSQPRRISSET